MYVSTMFTQNYLECILLRPTLTSSLLSKDMIASRSRIDHLKRHLGALHDDSKVEAVTISDANIVIYDDGRGRKKEVGNRHIWIVSDSIVISPAVI